MALLSPFTQAFSGGLAFYNLIRNKFSLALEIQCELLSLQYITLHTGP